MDTVAERTRTARPRRLSADAAVEGLPLSDEAPVTIIVDDVDVVTLMCTPRDLKELTVGWLYAEGLIEKADDVVSLAGCAHAREMLVRVAAEPRKNPERRPRLVTSGCGAAGDVERLRHGIPPRVRGDVVLPIGRLRELMREMLRKSDLYHATGGVHSAALATADGIVVEREDIGRHNAIDKVVGFGLLNGLDFGRLIMLATGRLSSEMVWKAALAGVPIVASLSVPSTLARDIALRANVTLVGRAAAVEPYVYTYPERTPSAYVAGQTSL